MSWLAELIWLSLASIPEDGYEDWLKERLRRPMKSRASTKIRNSTKMRKRRSGKERTMAENGSRQSSRQARSSTLGIVATASPFPSVLGKS